MTRTCLQCGAMTKVSRFIRRSHSVVIACTRGGCPWQSEVSRALCNYPQPRRPAAHSSFMGQFQEERRYLKEELSGAKQQHHETL